MPIDTINKKLALLDDEPYEAALPLSPGVFDHGERQHLLWGYPGMLWVSLIPVEPELWHTTFRVTRVVAGTFGLGQQQTHTFER